MLPDSAIPEPVLSAWQRCLSAWSDPSPHDALLSLVAHHNCFAWAAARYREKAEAGDAIATARLARLRRAAEAALLATATVRPDTSTAGRSNVQLFVLALVALLAIVAVTLLVMGARTAHR